MAQTIGFIGLGNMGGRMAANLLKAGYRVTAYDVAPSAVAAIAAQGGTAAAAAADVLAGADAVITMLPAGPEVRAIYLGDQGLIARAAPGTLLIDCSTIDVDSARTVAAAAAECGLPMLDAPVSGGVAGAEAGTLTFMVGGAEAAVERARPLLQAMGRTVVHAGGPGTGQAAKICNNMILGINMIAVCESFALADRLGLARQTLFDISAKSSGQCWALTSNCPFPGPVPASPANRDYRPGFAAAMMLKDLRLAAAAAGACGAAIPLGAEAAQLYQLFCGAGGGNKDFSGIFEMFGRSDLSASS